MDQNLSLDDLGKIAGEIHEVSKWYRIGLLLEVSPTCLDKIKEEERDSSDKLIEMLKAWLKKVEPKPTWSALVQALRNHLVGEEKEASRLEEKYTETALVSSVQLPEDSKTTTKRVSTSSQMPIPKVPIMSLEAKCSNAEKGCSWKGNSKEQEHHRRLTRLKEEVACPYSEVGCEIRCLREELEDHQIQSQRYHLDLTLATIKTLKDELKQNNIRCKNAQFGCDWRGKSIEERDAHTAVCPKEQIQCPFDEEFQCRDVYFHREELNVHLQHHITSLHTQFKTCQYQSCPITFTIPGFQSSLLNLDRCDNDIRTKEYKFPFYIRDRKSYMCIHQGAYLMRLCISVKSENGIDVYVESMPGSYDHRLPRSGRATIGGYMHSSSDQPNLQDRQVHFDFLNVTITPPTAGQSPVKCTDSIHYNIDLFYTQHSKVSDSEYFIIIITVIT